MKVKKNLHLEDAVLKPTTYAQELKTLNQRFKQSSIKFERAISAVDEAHDGVSLSRVVKSAQSWSLDHLTAKGFDSRS